ncbi:MAG TPA: DUF5916 domain-containing protein [Gemmatimonas sp.]|nr:DUF5916 domain-containing protein [Gemmatimonas sp.]
MLLIPRHLTPLVASGWLNVASNIALLVALIVGEAASALAQTAPPAAAQPTGRGGPVFDGRRGATMVPTPRTEATATIDGNLDEPAWRTAAALTGFSQFFPLDGVAAEDSTEVLVWYSATDLHVGIRAFAPPGSVRATLADRDRITQDDNVQLFLGTYDDSRQAFVFGVNPFGIQSDGVLNETGAQSGGGFTSSSARSRESADLAPDYVWQSKGRLTPWGYEVEMRIPFKSLRYRAGDEQRWQVHVIRTVQATGHEESWAPAVRAQASFLSQAGRLTGLRDLRRGLTLDLVPTVTSSVAGAPVVGNSRWAYTRSDPDVGGTVRWGITSNLTLSATANPDFSQVEADATQFALDPRSAVFFPERRPFFLESQEQFSVPNQLVYTRRIVQPAAAVKLSGKYRGFDIGVLSAVDSRDGSVDDAATPVYNILRLQRDVGAQSRIGLVYTDRVEGNAFNRVAGVDGRYVRGLLSLQGQFANSFTSTPLGQRSAPLWNGAATITGRQFYARYALSAIDPDFLTSSGFIARPGIANLQATHRYTFLGRPGALVENVAPEIYVLGRYQYDAFVGGRAPQDRQLHLRGNMRLRGGWQTGAQVLIESFGYDRALYANYVTFRPVAGGGEAAVPYTGTPTLSNLDWVLSVATPEFKRFSFNTFYIFGRDENFPEWSSARVSIWQGALNVRPTGQLRLSATWNREAFDRQSDGSEVLFRNVRRLRSEYQVTRQIFFRLIAEHTRARQDSLRDDGRTERPVFLRSANGTFRRAAAFDQERLRFDYLFSYLPTPGTVIYAGYGDARAANEPQGPEKLARTRDVFFVKLSYLYRVR